MASVNKVILIGNLGANPETRYLPSGDAITALRIATNERYKDKTTGEFKEATEWHRVVLFGRLAEVAGEYLKKGSAVYIEGRIRTRKWQDQSGQDRYSTEIVADQMQMLGGRGDNSSTVEGGGHAREPFERGGTRGTSATADSPGGKHSSSSRPNAPPARGGFEDMDDDVPF